MTIGIDIDDTITETTKCALKYLAEYDPLYQDHHDLPKEKYDEFMNIYLDRIIKETDLKDNVKESLEYLNKKGHKIIFITARNNHYSDNMINYTLEYFKKHKLKYDEIIFDKDKKGKIAKEKNISIFIDDKEEVLDDISKYYVECLRFTNKESKYKTYSNWLDIVKHIEKGE